MIHAIDKDKRRRIGTILAYSADANGGVVSSQRGTPYFFESREWCHPEAPPVAGEPVTFQKMNGKQQAIKVRRWQSKKIENEQK